MCVMHIDYDHHGISMHYPHFISLPKMLSHLENTVVTFQTLTTSVHIMLEKKSRSIQIYKIKSTMICAVADPGGGKGAMAPPLCPR